MLTNKHAPDHRNPVNNKAMCAFVSIMETNCSYHGIKTPTTSESVIKKIHKIVLKLRHFSDQSN
jgi:hypothetical protein